MKLHRFIGKYSLHKKQIEISDINIINQIKNVLRLKMGDDFIICDGKENEAMVKILDITKEQIIVNTIEMKERKDINKKVSLYLAILKKENFELAIQKAVEIGINEIHPIITERTIKMNLNYKRLEKIIKEASEQSGRTILPKIYPITSFKEAILNGKKNQVKIFFDLKENKDIKNYKKNNNKEKSASIFIGPEGGFTINENNFAKENQYQILSLSQFTLRAETACIIGLYEILNKI